MAIKHIIQGGFGDVHKIVTAGYTSAETVHTAATDAADADTHYQAFAPGADHEAADVDTAFEAHD